MNMLSQLYVANFKSISDQGMNIQPKPLTVLTGANGSGKSSILEALCLLAQSLGHGGPNINGEFVRFGSLQAFMHKRELDRLLQISLTISELTTEGRISSPGVLYAYRQSPNEVTQKAMSDQREIVTMHWEPATGTISYSWQDDPILKVPAIGVDPKTVLS